MIEDNSDSVGSSNEELPKDLQFLNANENNNNVEEEKKESESDGSENVVLSEKEDESVFLDLSCTVCYQTMNELAQSAKKD